MPSVDAAERGVDVGDRLAGLGRQRQVALALDDHACRPRRDSSSNCTSPGSRSSISESASSSRRSAWPSEVGPLLEQQGLLAVEELDVEAALMAWSRLGGRRLGRGALAAGAFGRLGRGLLRRLGGTPSPPGALAGAGSWPRPPSSAGSACRGLARRAPWPRFFTGRRRRGLGLAVVPSSDLLDGSRHLADAGSYRVTAACRHHRAHAEATPLDPDVARTVTQAERGAVGRRTSTRRGRRGSRRRSSPAWGASWRRTGSGSPTAQARCGR